MFVMSVDANQLDDNNVEVHVTSETESQELVATILASIASQTHPDNLEYAIECVQLSLDILRKKHVL